MTENLTPDQDQLDGVEDFDAYWRDYGKKGTPVRIMGDVVHLPASLPLRFQTEATRLQHSESLDDIAHLVSVLLPEDADVLDRWLAKGMDVERLGVFLIYATQRIAGKSITFADAAEQYAEQLAAKQARDAEGGEADTDTPT